MTLKLGSGKQGEQAILALLPSTLAFPGRMPNGVNYVAENLGLVFLCFYALLAFVLFVVTTRNFHRLAREQ